MIVLYFYNILWHLYRLTYIGRQFVKLQPQQTQMIKAIIGQNIAALSLDITLCVFTYCFKFSERLLPEIGDVIRWVFRCSKKIVYLTFDQAG